MGMDEDDAAMRDAFLDGAEIFALTAAVGVKARAAYVEHKTAKVAQAAGYVEHLPPRAVTSVWGDLPLYVAVVAGTILRRLSRAREESTEGRLQGVPSSVKARLAFLEQANDSVMEVSRRTARDVSRLGTRVRLTRRELSPPLRKVQAESKENAQILAAVAQRIELLEGELAEGQSTMSGLHTVSSKQFDVLSKAIADLKASQIELQAALAELPEREPRVEPASLESVEYETVPRRATKTTPASTTLPRALRFLSRASPRPRNRRRWTTCKTRFQAPRQRQTQCPPHTSTQFSNDRHHEHHRAPVRRAEDDGSQDARGSRARGQGTERRSHDWLY